MEKYQVFGEDETRVQSRAKRLKQLPEYGPERTEDAATYPRSVEEYLHRSGQETGCREGQKALEDIPERRRKGEVRRTRLRSPMPGGAVGTSVLVSEPGVIPWAPYAAQLVARA